MIIKSKFKDYYDYVAHQYGGGDPKCIYSRNRVVNREVFGGTSIAGTLELTQKNIVSLPYPCYGESVRYKWLAVCGKYYLLVSHTVMDGFTKPQWKLAVKNYDHEPPLSGYFTRRTAHDVIGQFSPYLVELSRKINAPVFTFDKSFRSENVIIDGELPILATLGFTCVMDAEQLYQEIAYFLSNVIKESPDMSPPSKMTDKEKISQHGFDLKKSFRHRV